MAEYFSFCKFFPVFWSSSISDKSKWTKVQLSRFSQWRYRGHSTETIKLQGRTLLSVSRDTRTHARTPVCPSVAQNCTNCSTDDGGQRTLEQEDIFGSLSDLHWSFTKEKPFCYTDWQRLFLSLLRELALLDFTMHGGIIEARSRSRLRRLCVCVDHKVTWLFAHWVYSLSLAFSHCPFMSNSTIANSKCPRPIYWDSQWYYYFNSISTVYKAWVASL